MSDLPCDTADILATVSATGRPAALLWPPGTRELSWPGTAQPPEHWP